MRVLCLRSDDMDSAFITTGEGEKSKAIDEEVLN